MHQKAKDLSCVTQRRSDSNLPTAGVLNAKHVAIGQIFPRFEIGLGHQVGVSDKPTHNHNSIVWARMQF